MVSRHIFQMKYNLTKSKLKWSHLLVTLRQTIKFVLKKEDFETIKVWMNTNNRNYFEFLQRMPFYLMAPNGKIIEWSPNSNHD